MHTKGVGIQRLANMAVRAGHPHWDPWPVANILTSRRDHLNRHRLDILEHRRQVADHTPGFIVGQSHLQGPIEILDDITATAGNPKDDHVTYGPCADPPPLSC